MNKSYTIAVLGSHSALDVCRGAKDLGFKTLVICKKGREKTYKKYYATNGELGCVDEVIVLDEFRDILSEKVQQELLKRNAIFIPHRSFEVYINDYNAIEKKFKVPMFGNRFLLKAEERGVKPNQYDLLDAAQIRYPQQFDDPKKIDRLCIVKVLEKERGFERAFFFAESFEEYKLGVAHGLGLGKFTEEQIKSSVIEEFIVGVQVNFNFFYSPVNKRLELIGTDTRRQTNIEGLTKLPSIYEEELIKKIGVKYEEAGHIAVTVLESLLEDVFAMGERFVEASQKMVSPGVIGPFGLQTMITAGPPKKEIIVFDVSPRMPGSPGIFATPYSGYLFGQNISMGKRVAMEIKEAIEKGELKKVLT
ncbi:5-formaminoimidazole-4-carboxamide-1-(beta)-D-ribofuranosyl 5'-monophosphate synthetase [Candidatus Daviesbacteria bacterium RIFCSPLOWO2_02_FULL_41_8]|uniref:5-formaminoimidazole-4-carboxamide-1-(Beta)-D-ribofuranosyl 5'-monophosphate synthetase n=3 Tax=Candidatus Daviesiibacteriota TaxID=1752718 RepID=A0A1F5NN15_9BACT|nr:MAG: 5-formaminoimidazole-4-carboxamide-1-(beta)-D-ribofuranosyl 5'-monophosphate synthetase [Candidatus Daviesbacteria bacterium RIFCSPHIGHO2_01_FULL_41_23]OGE33342.1 MAG: 5-formaminoimidazole-4-carboxamide-1-(beta)-D-ribofuranosyl 5'-monophosphate synthetase [Candidatus Daviesbacteria bacterium RIFCSPHIGHO2_02_FULL_41_10]OGE78760.1 MAG: 5-formaminoimidazole-4-carboxamide-1-(beta)-D-ribofuranosyl 5'-monophosphate synthetase [Candidatus Daviesbacteria bacterium RIFCSPLOWO2_02_FULL_41_8]